MAAPKLLALHRDVQVLSCDCDGCKGLGDSQWVAEPRTDLDASLPPEIGDVPEPPDHIHIRGEVVEVRYNLGVPYGIHACEVCGITMEPR